MFVIKGLLLLVFVSVLVMLVLGSFVEKKRS